MLRSCLALVVFAVLALPGAGGCRVPAGALTPLDAGQLEARVALEREGAYDDPIDHAVARAEAEAALDRPDRAAEAMMLALRRAEALEWNARLSGDEAAARSARRRREQVARSARRWAARADAPDMMVSAVLASAHPRRHRRALRRAVARLHVLPGTVDPVRVLELVGDDPDARRRVAGWLRFDPDEIERLGVLEGLGTEPATLDVHQRQLARAVEKGWPADRLRPRIDAVLAADPWHMDAGLLAVGLDEVAAGILSADDPLLPGDLLGDVAEPTGALARLTLRRRRSTSSRAVPLALARRMLMDEQVGDAHGVLESMSPPRDPRVRALYEQLVAMTALQRGDVAAFEHWRVSHDVRSPSVDEALLLLGGDDRSPPLRQAARRAGRRWVHWQLEPPAETVRWNLLLDDHVREADRRRLYDGISWQAEAQRAHVEICRDHGYDGDGCSTLGVLAMLELAGRTRHLHPEQLRTVAWMSADQLRALAPMLAHYRGTELAASPEAQHAWLRVELATGDYEAARARLRDQGALLPAWARTWGWLVIDDLEAGVVTLDEARGGTPSFSEIVWEPERGERYPGQLARYDRAMQEAQAGRHTAALAELMPLLDALPDAVMVEGLAQAALAAHRSGDAAQRDRLRLRLHAVDPHGATYARLQASLSRGAGRTEEARAFLEHALAWHPDDVALYQSMVTVLGDAPDQLGPTGVDFIAHGAPGLDYVYFALRRAIRRGSLTDPATVARVIGALEDGPEAAWALEPAVLAELAELRGWAMDWGLEQLSQATDLAQAQHWAAATLTMLEGSGPVDQRTRGPRVWLALLLGRVEAGLALARRYDPGHEVVPMSEGDSVVVLLRARAAGEIDDTLAWDLWRWSYDGESESSARIEALLLDPPRGTLVQAFACGELVGGEPVGPALDVCDEAGADQPDSLSIAVNRAFLSFQHPDEAQRRAMGASVFGHDLAVPTFETAPAVARGQNLPQVWHQNYAVWLGERGDHAAAAMEWWQAHALGDTGTGGQHEGFAQLRYRGALVRALQDHDDRTPREADLRHGIMALSGAEPVVARGYAESARTRVPERPGALDRRELMLPDRLRHLADWAERDLHQGHLDAEGMAEAISLVFTPDLPRAQALSSAHPHASLATLAVLLAHRELDDTPPLRPLAEALVERHPDDPLAVAHLLPRLVAAGEDERARALYERAHAAHPGDTMLLYADAPESITGPRDGVPAWVRDPARFDERMARVTDAAVDRLVPVRHDSEERAAEVFVPLAFMPVEGRALRFVDGYGARLLVLEEPRASRCQGADCARDLVKSLTAQGRTRQWMRPTTVGGQPATQLLFTDAEEVLVAWVLPTGGRVLTVVGAATVERFDALLPALTMLRDGVRPLDAVLPPLPARSLRAAGATLGDRERLRARREQNRAAAEGCPVLDTLTGLPHDHQRAELLVDLWLATPASDARRALLRCTGPRDAAARRLALVTLLDEHPEAHAFGREAVAVHPTRVVADVRTIASSPLTPPVSDPDYLRRTDLPPHGLVEVLGALPPAHAAGLLERLLTSADARDVTLAWAALQLRPSLATDDAITRGLAGDARLVAQVAYLLAERDQPGDAQRLRDALDARPPAAEHDDQAAVRSLASAVATRLDPRDEDRLQRAVTRIVDGDDPPRAERMRDDLRALARDHQRGRALVDDPSRVPDDDDTRALRWRDDRERRTRSYRDADDLRGKALADVLPGRDWTFARLAAPGLFSSTVADVAGRLTTGDEAVDQRLGDLATRMLREGGLGALSEGGGIDATRPIECAKPSGDNGWLCTAWVSDRQALLLGLGQRASGDDAGVSLPLSVATTAGFVPAALSLLPALLHPLVYPDDDDDDDGPDDLQDATERARMRLQKGELTLERYSIIDARTHRIGIDTERYLFIDDRVWVFSTEGTMERALRVDEQPPLAADPEFQRLTARWQGGAALQAVALGRAWSLAEGGASMEVVLDETGLDFRYAGAFESEEGVHDIEPALAQLPAGAVTTFAHGLGGAQSFDAPLEAEGSDAARVPPMPVLAHAPGLAFGWYLEDDDRLWRRWLAVAPLGADLRARLRRAKTPPGRGESRRHGGLCYRERDGYLLVGDCALVDRSAEGPAPPPPSREQLRVAHGTFDGRAAAERLPGLGGLTFEQKALMRGVAPLLGVFTEMRVRADWSPAQRTAVLEGHVGLRLRPAGDRSRVIDDWLAASEGHNAATLPRRLRSDELESSLRYRLEVPDAEAFVRDTVAPSPRMHAEVEDPTHVVLVVEPVPTAPLAVPLTADERKDATERTAEFRTEHPAIVGVAARLAPAGTAAPAAAEAIGAWVHGHLTYEVTPRSLDGAAILEAGRGDCTEYAQLTVTLLRAAGVPAEVRSGMAASGSELVAHAWVAYHDGTSWRELDPTWGRPTVSAGHLEMSVLDVLALISLGKLRVVEISRVP